MNYIRKQNGGTVFKIKEISSITLEVIVFAIVVSFVTYAISIGLVSMFSMNPVAILVAMIISSLYMSFLLFYFFKYITNRINNETQYKGEI